jgi:hypothetical protein
MPTGGPSRYGNLAATASSCPAAGSTSDPQPARAGRAYLPARVAWPRVAQRAGGRGVRRVALAGVLEAFGAVGGSRLHVVGVAPDWLKPVR